MVLLFILGFIVGKALIKISKYSFPVDDLIAILNGLGWAIIIHLWGFNILGCIGLIIITVSLAICVIDIIYLVIPDILLLLLAGTGIIYHICKAEFNIYNILLGLGIGFLIPALLAVISKNSIGGGDIKLSAVFGIWLGCPDILKALLLAALSGSIYCIIMLLFKRLKRKDVLPFGPFLILGFYYILLS